MTENEALEKHKEDCRRCKDKACMHGVDCLQKKDIEVYEEIQVYRAIGTVEDIQEVMKSGAYYMEIAHRFQSIGTIEEFKALKEKSEPKKILKCEDSFKCPICNHWVGYRYGYCDGCGQKLDWE